VDLPTYTNIWRIEKRLYKLYDFRLPAPLPITWIAVFAGITVPYVVFLVAVGLPFNHTVVWLYVLPPGVLTWLTTRPVIESKRLPELVTSQLRYLAEPRIWCRMAPFAEKDEIQFVVRVWRRQPSRRPQPAPAHETAVPVPAVPVPAAGKAPEAPPAPTAGTAAAAARAAAAAARVLVRQRAAARPRPAGRDRGRGAVRPPARHTGSSGETPPDPGMLEVSHDADPGSPVPPAPPSWPSLPAVGAAPPAPGPRAGSSPHPGPRAGSSPQAAPHAEPEPPSEPVPAAVPPPAAGTPAWRETPAHLTPARSVAARVAARFLELDREDRPLPSVQRAVSGPGSGGETWRRRVKVVAGGRGERDRETLDRGRARLPLPGPRRIVVLGCTEGAGQTVTALMTGRLLAAIRDAPVAALDLNPGPAGLAARSGPVASVASLLAAAPPRRDDARPAARLDVIAGPDGTRALDAGGYRRVADLLAAWYPLTLIDPAPAELTRVLPVADQLLLVVPASPDAATSLASTQQWLAAHGYRELAGRAVTVINGVSGRTGRDVLEAESVARGRCRAIVRVPWDDQVAAPRPPAAKARPAPPLQPQTRTAYTALAGVLVAGMAALPAPAVPGGSSGEPAD
jgi:MinD-like ATPase involved in chromosome partitioning or flagellar assembly